MLEIPGRAAEKRPSLICLGRATNCTDAKYWAWQPIHAQGPSITLMGMADIGRRRDGRMGRTGLAALGMYIGPGSAAVKDGPIGLVGGGCLVR